MFGRMLELKSRRWLCTSMVRTCRCAETKSTTIRCRPRSHGRSWDAEARRRASSDRGTGGNSSSVD